jgi:cytochrome c peroxidase
MMGSFWLMAVGGMAIVTPRAAAAGDSRAAGPLLQSPGYAHPQMGDLNGIIDFPPAPKLDVLNRLSPGEATPEERRGEALFHGKAQCAACHPAASHFTDNTMHDLRVERFHGGRAEGPIKTFPLRGIKDSPPYLHDGRLLTLEDAVEFFNIVLGTQLAADEKRDLVAYLRCL